MRSDARRFQRVDIEAPARIEFTQSRKRRMMETRVSNISAAGAFFPALKSILPGKQVKVEIFLLFDRIDVPDEQDELITLSASAVVTRSSHSGTAVAFAEDYRMTSSRILGDLLVTQDATCRSGGEKYDRSRGTSRDIEPEKKGLVRI